MKLFLCALCFLLVLSVTAQSQKRGLIVLDDLQIRHTHSIFFRNLEQSGYQLTYKEATDPNLALSRYGDYTFDFLVLFASQSDGFGGSLDVDAILNFIDDGNDVIVAVGSEVSDPMREVALECGVEFGSDGSYVLDHFNFDTTDYDGDHTLIVADDVLDAPIITGKVTAPLLYRGIDLVLEDDNELLLPVVTASSSAYSGSPDDPLSDAPHSKGKDTALLAVLQARNNARILFSGSLDFFSDRFLESSVQKYSPEGTSQKYDRSGNAELIRNVVSWTLSERGVLRASNVVHHKVGTREQGSIYAVLDQISYHVDIHEWNGEEWVPYTGNDVQLEFVMLDPYIRTNLTHDNAGHYTTTFKVPDVYGIFTFRLSYQRVGFTTINENRLVTIRPFRHNEYERYIVAAYPYYASSFSMMVGLVIFSFFFLYHKEKKVTKS